MSMLQTIFNILPEPGNYMLKSIIARLEADRRYNVKWTMNYGYISKRFDWLLEYGRKNQITEEYKALVLRYLPSIYRYLGLQAAQKLTRLID